MRLFSYERPKVSELGLNEIIIMQSDQSRRQDGWDQVRLEVTTRGMIIIDTNVTGRISRGPDDMTRSYYIYNDDVETILKKCFVFCNFFYTTKDPYQRYDRLFYNVGLRGIGYRSMVSQKPQGNSYSFPHSIEEVVSAFDQPRLITIRELGSPVEEIGRVISLFSRRLKRQ